MRGSGRFELSPRQEVAQQVSRMSDDGRWRFILHYIQLASFTGSITIPFSGDIEFHDSGNGWGGLEHEGAERSVHLCGWSGCLHLPLCPLSPSCVPCPGALPGE